MLPFYLQLLETEGEKQKFERLYERYRRLMHWIAVRILQDEHLAEDAVHEAFLRILQNFDGIDEILSSETRNFVAIVVRNTSLNLKKKQKREDEKLVKDVFSEEERQGQGDRLQTVIENLSYGFDETADAVCRQEIIDAVLSMPDTLKEILMLYGVTANICIIFPEMFHMMCSKKWQIASDNSQKKRKPSKMIPPASGDSI